MAEAFLEEQLRRIRKMTEQVSRVRPLSDAWEPSRSGPDEKGAAHDETPPRRHASRQSSRRRGR